MHLSGITPALSEDCRALVLWAAREARTSGARVSFDVNYRSKLWGTEEAREFVEEILPDVYLLLAGDEEARALWGRDDEGFVRELAERGPEEVVLKRGSKGSLALIEGEVLEHPASEVEEVDPVGAGDAFAAGYLAAHLWGLPAGERLRVANAMGALSVATLGDYEGLPNENELWAFLEGEVVAGWGGESMQDIEGVYVANVTPFRDDSSFSVDEDAYLDHVAWLAEMGVRGVVPFGTNGEGPSVTLGEKLRVLEALFGRGFPLQIIPAVMQNNLPETARNAARPGRLSRYRRARPASLLLQARRAGRDGALLRDRCSRLRATQPSSTTSPSTPSPFHTRS